MFTLGQNKSFGIDIGTQTIKIVEVSHNLNKFSIDNYSIWDDDLDSVIQQKDSNVALAPQKITDIIKAMTARSGMRMSNAYIALPSYLALFAIIQVPILEEKEFLSAVPLEAKKHIPVPLSSVQLDWINLGKNKLQDQYNILIIAVPNTVANRYLEVTKALNIKVKGFELDCFSILRSIDLPKENTCIIDIGARNSTVIVVDADKKLQTIQSFDFGGNQITESIKQMRGCSILEAENLKKENGVNNKDPKIAELIQSKINSFIVKDVIRLLGNVKEIMDIDINSVVILGGTSKMTGVRDYIGSIFKNQFNNTNMNISIASPISNLSVKGLDNDDLKVDIWQDLILSIGVALKKYIE
jgi:type IV pilus assembly protein PilM